MVPFAAVIDSVIPCPTQLAVVLLKEKEDCPWVVGVALASASAAMDRYRCFVVIASGISLSIQHATYPVVDG
jgi:hypothetical protein